MEFLARKARKGSQDNLDMLEKMDDLDLKVLPVMRVFRVHRDRTRTAKREQKENLAYLVRTDTLVHQDWRVTRVSMLILELLAFQERMENQDFPECREKQVFWESMAKEVTKISKAFS